LVVSEVAKVFRCTKQNNHQSVASVVIITHFLPFWLLCPYTLVPVLLWFIGLSTQRVKDCRRRDCRRTLISRLVFLSQTHWCNEHSRWRGCASQLPRIIQCCYIWRRKNLFQKC